MATESSDAIMELTPPPTPTTPRPLAEGPIKLKGRQRLLQGLQRISSSSNIPRLVRTTSTGYGIGSKASVSCISLNTSDTSFGYSYGSLAVDASTGYSTAPTSAVSTPGFQIPSFKERARYKYLNAGTDGSKSVPVAVDFRPASRLGATPGIAEEQDYFSISVARPKQKRPDFNFWQDLPSELRMEVLSYLEPKHIVRSSAVSKMWHRMCFDGQLWAVLDTAEFYQNIPAEALVKVITSAGPFMRDLNLRGCVQLREKWHTKGLADACRNLENFSLEGCRIDRTSIHCLLQNTRLLHINLSGLAGATNAAMKVIAQHCPKLEHLNVSWCNNIDTRGLMKIFEACPNLFDLRAGEVRGWDDLEVMQVLFESNTLERLVLMNCDSLSDDSLAVLIEGRDSERDCLTGRPIIEPRRLKHLDITRCRAVTDKGLMTCINNIPDMEGLQLSKCRGITDVSLNALLPTMPKLTHLDLEELNDLTNAALHTLAHSPCAPSMRHLSISYCESLGDSGMIPVLKNCAGIRSLDMDNTRISDLVLAEAAAMVRQRSSRTISSLQRPDIGLRMVAYDCQNVTWTGVREVLSRNAEVHSVRRAVPMKRESMGDDGASPTATAAATEVQITRTYPTEVIQLKCFYNYQPTVEEHTKRVLRCDYNAAKRLERMWAEFMMAQEEAGVTGSGSRRRRRRAREAQMMHADEEDLASSGAGGVGGGRRRRARSGGCVMM